MKIYDGRLCELGEGPLWHPLLEQLFWFDILGKRLLSKDEAGEREWPFQDLVSAAGWVDRDTLLIASERSLFRFVIESCRTTEIAALEADNPATRSNDGRADPFGGFWIGTMSKSAEAGAGSIYRYYRGELRKVASGMAVTNSIAFSPDRSFACYADTKTKVIRKAALDVDGSPTGEALPWIDLTATGENPDGAVFDAQGCLWVALWGSGCVARFGPDGKRLGQIQLPVPQPSCPSFGGPELDRLYVTTAREDMAEEALDAAPDSGAVFELEPGVRGLPEPMVIL